MAHPLTNPGGQVLFAEGELVTETDIERIGAMAAQTSFHLLARLLQDDDADPIEGFFGDDCKVTAAGLVATIAAGWGLQYDTAVDATFTPCYRPIVLSVSTTQAITAHDATNPRHDILAIKANTSDDQNAVRSVQDLTDDSWSAPSIPTRRRWGYTLSYTAGTPAASPADPATPSGYIAIARIRVPATAGAVTVDDLRPRIVLSSDLPTDLGTDYAVSFVPGTSTECQVSASSPASMVLVVASGTVVINGRRRRIGRTQVTVTVAHATNNRYDVVAANQDGTLEVVKGVEDGTAAVPAVASDQLALAKVYVAATDTTLDGATITDLRERLPFDGASIRVDSLQADQMAGTTKPIKAALTAGGEASNHIDVTVAAQDADGNAVAAVRTYLARLYSASMEPLAPADWDVTEVGAGGEISTGGSTGLIFSTSAGGAATIRVTDSTGAFAGTVYLIVEPFNYPGVKVYQSLLFS